MAYIDGIPIRDSIHTDSSIVSGEWIAYRNILTGQFISGGGASSNRYGEFTNDIREYNKKINTLTGHWDQTGLFLTPHNAGFKYTGTGDFTAYPLITSTTTTYSITNGADDGTAISSATTSTSVPTSTFSSLSNNSASFISAGSQYDSEEGKSNYFVAYFRYDNIIADQGATVQSAVLKPIKIGTSRGEGQSSAATEDFEIAAIDEDNPSTPSTPSDVRLTKRTTARVTLTASSVNSVTNGDRFDSPDIKTIIQEIVDRSGWSSGNSILLVLYTPTNNNGFTASLGKFGAQDGTDQSAQLEITV